MKSKEQKQKPDRRRRNSIIITIMWSLFSAIMLFVFTFFILVYNGVIGYMPPVEDFKNPVDSYASVIYTADGIEMGRYYKKGNRVSADYDEISQHVIDALVATEDERFYEHSGIDMRAVLRVVVKTGLMGNDNAGGGSTISQQLAKQLYSPESNSTLERAMQKPIEWMIAVKLERFYSKDEIIRMYLNQFDFLNNAVGIKTAAKVYFNKDVKDLTIEEAATLVGMVKNPALYNPVRFNERTRERRNVVLSQMYKADMITSTELDSLQELPLKLDFNRVDHKSGLAPYFREELRRYLTAKKPDRNNYPNWDYQRFRTDSIEWENNPLYGWVEKNPKPDGTKWDIYNDGLRIYTTIDSRMQQYAEEAVNEHMQDLQRRFFRETKGKKRAPYTASTAELSDATWKKLVASAIRQSDRYRIAKAAGRSDKEIEDEFATPVEMTVFSYSGMIDTMMTPRDSILYHKHFLRTGFMSMDPKTGYVKAYVGGPDFRQFQYDMVSTGRRQIGSTIKPFLYTYAMEDGFTPCSQLLNEQPTIYDDNGRPWQPRNSGSARIGEMVDLRWALTNSNNWISARLMDQLSPHQLVTNMHNYGITSVLDPVVSICLGSCEVSVKEMVTAYSAFANGGMRVDPMYVTAIADANGNIISHFSPRQTHVISDKGYYRILSILLNVVDHGTGSRLRRIYGLTAQIGGKTGTTNYNADGWFMGFTPDLVSGTWVGGEERYIHFRYGADGQGAEMALPIYGKFLKKIFADKTLPYSQDSKFEFPADFNPCEDELEGEEFEEESIEGAFD